MSALHRSTCSSICCLQWCLYVHTAASHACADEAGRRRRTFLARCDWQPAAESQRGKIVRLAGSSRASLSPSPSSLDRCGAQVEAGSDRCRLALEHASIDRLGKTRGEESTKCKTLTPACTSGGLNGTGGWRRTDEAFKVWRRVVEGTVVFKGALRRFVEEIQITTILMRFLTQTH